MPVIIVSIIDQKGKGFALGAADYLVKPIQKGELLRTLGTFSLTSKVRTAPVSILVIDDDPKAVELVATALEPEGFHILRAYNGETGVAMAETERSDLIMLDVLMPGMGITDLSRLPLGHRHHHHFCTSRHIFGQGATRTKRLIIRMGIHSQQS